ncbi:hypothetical protein PMI15_01756 [Polaromonas sp. CF318]|uniref:hypothetical protein n=1 Tax=Polaromonas sp. CF318 TaxID=1144318 RepID=UPI0002714C34|nr:hypothetical protein [Polaromonas sp. CF318]EJL85511.1 hypothetical protein PMI15_01756 [Polaromonas sp. CF318]
MQIRVSSIAAEGVAAKLRDITNFLEAAILKDFESKTFGDFALFMLTVVCTEDDYAENLRLSQKIKNSGKYKDFFSGKMTKFLNLAVPVDVNTMSSLSIPQGIHLIVNTFSGMLKDHALPQSKGFDSEKFRLNMLETLDALK